MNENALIYKLISLRARLTNNTKTNKGGIIKMVYDGTLVMPTSYALMDREELTYVDGGGTFKVQIGEKSFVMGALGVLGGGATATAISAALDAIGVSIAAAIELGTAGAGTLAAGAFILAWGGIASAIAGYAVNYGINSLKGKTFTVISASYIPDITFTI